MALIKKFNKKIDKITFEFEIKKINGALRRVYRDQIVTKISFHS